MNKSECARKVCEALAPMKDWEHQSAPTSPAPSGLRRGSDARD